MDNSLAKRLLGKTISSIIVIGSILSFLIPCSLNAREDADSAITLKVGFYELNGYHEISSTGARSGYGYDFLTLMRRYVNVKYEYIGYDKTWNEMKQMLLDGEIDFVTSAQKSESMLSQFDFSSAIGSASIQLNVRFEDVRFVSGDYKTYNGMKIGLVEGGRSVDRVKAFAKENGFSFTPVFFKTASDLTQALHSGEIDAIASSSLRKSTGEKTLSEFDIYNFYAIVKKGNTEVLDIINKAIVQINGLEGNWKSDLYYKHFVESSFSGLMFTKEEQQYIYDHSKGGKKISVAFDNSWAPFVHKDGQKYVGIIPDYWDLIVNMTGMQYEFFDSANDLIDEADVLSDKVDIYFAYASDPTVSERQGFVESPSFMDAGACFLTIKGRTKPVVKIGVSGVNPGLNKLIELEEGQSVIEFANSQELFKALEKGAVDEAFMYALEGQYLLNVDLSGSLVYRIVPDVSMKVCAVSADTDNHTLISIVSKCMKVITEAQINSLIADNLTYAVNDVDLRDYIRMNPWLTILFALIVLSFVFSALYYALKHRDERRFNEELKEKVSQISTLNSELQSQYDIAATMSHDITDCLVVDVNSGVSKVVKRKGVVLPEGKRLTIQYSLTWDTFISKYVHPDDRDMVRAGVQLDTVLEHLSMSNEYSLGYRNVDLGETRYYQILFTKLIGSERKLMFGFRCVDEMVKAEQQKNALLREANEIGRERLAEITSLNANLKETTEIIANAGYGVWRIKLNPGGRNTMTADDTLKRILGIENMDMSPEELYVFYHDRLLEDIRSIENDDYNSMNEGEVRTKSLTWQHPTKGIVFFLAGGTRYTTPEGQRMISGYSADITSQKKQEDRSNLIISALAHSFTFLNYVDLANRSYINMSANLQLSEEDKRVWATGDLDLAVEYITETRVSPGYQSEMKRFMDFHTLKERMAHRHMIMNQFQHKSGVWYECSFIVANRTVEGEVRHVIWTMRKIEDEKQAEIRKQRIIDDNIAANKSKTKFLQNMSHEIRTPLNAMFGFAQLLGLPDGSWTQEEKDQYNRYIFNSYNMLDMLIGDIIDISDSEHGNYRIDISDVNVNAVCQNALMSAEFRKPADVNMYFTSDIPDEYTIQSDGRRIQQVLINYLTNACKHTIKGEIHLHCSSTETPGKLTLSVTDTGTGVPPEKADIIFDRFTKLDQFVQGSGLGLNICQTIADKLGGKVYLDKTYTTGARFVFVIDNE